MDYFILTNTSLFKLIKGESGIDPNAAYQDFVVQTIDLCRQSDDGYKAIALTYAETELQFAESSSGEAMLLVRKALAFVRKMQRLVTRGRPVVLSAETQKTSKLKWTGKPIELVELIYGISVMGSINDGAVPLKELVEELFGVFGVESSKGCYRIYNDIKMRKSDSRTYYLDCMREVLNHKRREEDRRFR